MTDDSEDDFAEFQDDESDEEESEPLPNSDAAFEADPDRPPKDLIKIKDYARYRQVTPASVYQRIRSGNIKKWPGAMVSKKEANDKWHLGTKRVRMTGTTMDMMSESVADNKEQLIAERLRLEKSKADMHGLRLAQMKGELINKSGVLMLVERISRQNADGWLNWPKAIAIEMAEELSCDPALFHALLEAAVRKQLETISRLNFDVESIAPATS